jgi:hypothetical protein
MAEGETRTLDLGITADAAVLNVTVTEPTKGGYITVFPQGATDVPLASNINFVSTQTIANQVVVQATAGQVKIYNPAGETHVVVDLLGTFVVDDNTSFANAGLFLPVDPVRSYDSRNAPGTPMADQETRHINLVELNDRYPFEYGGVVANMTVVDTAAQGFMTAFPRSTALPFASNLNWLAGEVRPNLITAGTDEHGFTSFYNEGGSTNLVLDVAGFYTPHPTAV